MKNILVTMLFGMCVYFGFSQNQQDPPRNVRESFQKEYPQSTPSRWTRSHNQWSADFEDKDHDNGEVTAHFDSKGRHTDTYVPYDDKDVPGGIKDNLQKKYSGSDNYEYTRIDRSGGNSLYKVRMRHNKKYRTLYVDQDGREKEYHQR